MNSKRGKIYLDPTGETDEYCVGASITRSLRTESGIRIAYHGRDPENGDTFEGVIELACSLEEQAIHAEYANARGEKRHFLLTGRFIDDSFGCFEGKWIEPEFTLNCSIEDIDLDNN